MRQQGIPQAIFIEDGYMNLKDLAKKLPKQYVSETAGRVPGQPADRRGNKGTLEVDKETQELRLSQEAGSFLVNDGQLFVADTRVTGWREADNGPASMQVAEGVPSVPGVLGRQRDVHRQQQDASFGYDNSPSPTACSITQYTPNMPSVSSARSRPAG